MLRKVLIANRGEIAVRIIRTCRELGVKALAVYSDVDRTAPHVLLADEAVHIGPAPSSQSYLNLQRILQAASSTGADAVHPGYGFLSESAAFAQSVVDAGLTWIGPTPDTLARMGDKVEARRLALEVGLPVVPGSPDPLDDPVAAQRVAEEVGYPILIKSVGGGGGKGIRRVDQPTELPPAFQRATSEAAAAFGDGRVYVEKAISQPRHVEVQILADSHGHVVNLGERDCSIQRRYQKIIEETPSPFVDSPLRTQLGSIAVKLAAACGYLGAGTVEFLVDSHRQFYFLEMNTRLQVEHPITEMATGLDLVAEQLRIASGEPLSFEPADVQPRGHAIECRIYAEDGFDRFAPSTGAIQELTLPGGSGVRLDHGMRTGLEVTHHYDALLGKLCVWGRSRPEAVRRMSRALEELRIVGLTTTIPFCLATMHHPAFLRGEFDTGFISRYHQQLADWSAGKPAALEEAAVIGAAIFAARAKSRPGTASTARQADSPWLRQGRENQVSE